MTSECGEKILLTLFDAICKGDAIQSRALMEQCKKQNIFLPLYEWMASLAGSGEDIGVKILCDLGSKYFSGQKMTEFLKGAIRNATTYGHTKCVAVLLAYGSQPDIECAAYQGHIECLLLYLNAGVPQENTNLALAHAADQGHTECVRLLLPHSDPKAHNSRALRWAAHSGNAHCVRLLLPHSDATANNSEALQHACVLGATDIIDLLAPLSNENEALMILQEDHPNDPNIWMALHHRTTARQQKTALEKNVPKTEPHAPPLRKM